MKCTLCKSPRIINFIDGFGERRLFCRGCGRSFLNNSFLMVGQKRLQDFGLDVHFRPVPERRW